MYKSWRTGELFNSNKVNYLDFVVTNKKLPRENQIQTRPIIIQETCSTNKTKPKSNSNLPFNYENVINKYKK